MKAWTLASVAIFLIVTGCDRNERLVQQPNKNPVEESLPGKPSAKPPSLPPDEGVPPSSQQSK